MGVVMTDNVSRVKFDSVRKIILFQDNNILPFISSLSSTWSGTPPCRSWDITITSSLPLICWTLPWASRPWGPSSLLWLTMANRQVSTKQGLTAVQLYHQNTSNLMKIPSWFEQLVLTVGLLAVVVYLYTVVAFNFFRKFYNKSEDEDAPDMKCDDMMTVSFERKERIPGLEYIFTVVCFSYSVWSGSHLGLILTIGVGALLHKHKMCQKCINLQSGSHVT